MARTIQLRVSALLLGALLGALAARAGFAACGDVTGNGVVDAADRSAIRGALADPGQTLAVPLNCNVFGSANAGDANGDGLPDDCNLADVVVLARDLAGLTPPIAQSCLPPADPPIVPVSNTAQEPSVGDEDAPGVALYMGTVLNTGEARVLRTDLVIPGRGEIHFAMVRTYRSRLTYDGPLGHGWDFSYNEGLHVQPNGDVLRSGGSGHVDRWVRNPDGSYRAPRGFFGTLRRESDGRFLYREPDGFKHFYDASGRLSSHEDRFGNRMRFVHDARGNLDQVVDVFGRVIDFVFETQAGGVDRLVRLRDFSGREISYLYDLAGNLVRVTSPAVTGTPTGNDFPQGRSERYAYSSGFADARLNHNLLAVTAPEEVASNGPPFATFVYGTNPASAVTFDRVLSTAVGGVNASGVPAGGTTAFVYQALNTGVGPGNPALARLKVLVTERNGNQFESYSNEHGDQIQHRRLTRGLRPGEPAFYDTIFAYTGDGLKALERFPEGNSVTFAYDAGGPRAAQGNLLEVRRRADPARGGGEDLRTTATYEPVYNQIARVTDPRGHATVFFPPIGAASAARYTRTFLFDYQEGTGPIAEAVRFGIDTSSIARGLGDLNADGETHQTAGNVVRELAPAVTLLPDSQEAARLGSTRQDIVTELQWNDRGQLLGRIDPEGNLDRLAYFPENDPDGDGAAVSGAGSSQARGYLRSVTLDAGPAPARRTADVPPAELETTYGYDAVGNLIRHLNPRGVESQVQVNALNEPVVLTRGAETAQAIARGQLPTGEAPLRYLTRVFYDHNGRVTRVESENRDSTTPGVGPFVERTYVHDILDHRIAQSVEIGAGAVATRQFRYDPNELLSLEIAPEGNQRQVQYDERDLPFRITEGVGSAEASTVQMDYDRNGNAIALFDAQDHDGDGLPEAARLAYDGFDRLVRIRDRLGNQVERTYDPASNLASVRLFGHPPGAPGAPNVLLTESHYRHDELNRIYQLDQPLFVAAGFDPVRLVDLRDGNSDGVVTTRFEYDALSRSTFTREDDGELTQTTYDGASRPIEGIDAEGNRWTAAYDRNSNVVETRFLEVSPENLVPDEEFVGFLVWDQLDRLVRRSAGHTERFSYDSRDNLVTRSDAQGPPIADPLGLFPGEINGPGNTATFVYDGRDLLTGAAFDLRLGGQGGQPLDLSNPFNPDGQIVLSYEHDRNARLVGIVDDSGNRTSFEYDALDRVVRQTNADLTSYGFTLDRDDNPVTITDARGTVVQGIYDAAGRLVERTILPSSGVEGTTRETYAYDGLSRLTRATNEGGQSVPSHTVERVWDSLSRLLEERQDGQVISSVRSGDGRRLALTYPGGRSLSFSHDRIDRIDRISEGAQLIADYDWIGPDEKRFLRRSHGNATSMTFLDDSGTRDIGWDVFKRPLLLQHRKGPATLVARVHEYDRTDHRLFEERLDHRGLRDSYAYDSIYRLLGADYDQFGGASARRELVSSDFAYDGVGNRRRETATTQSAGTAILLHAVDGVHAYTQIGATTRSHDGDGNLTDDGELLYFFDHRDRLVRVARKSGGVPVAAYEYDALDRRVRKTLFNANGSVSKVTRYFHHGWQAIEEQNATGGTEVTYVYGAGIDEPVQMQATALAPVGADTFYYHQNARGDVAALSDASGAVVERTAYEAFGAPDRPSRLGNPYLFQGRAYDAETGLYYFRFRYLDPLTGRFLQRDPVRDPANLGNPYTFAGNDPVMGADPMGLVTARQRLEAAGGAVVGVGRSLWGFGETMGAIVVGGGAQWLGMDPKGYFGDAMRKADKIAEGIIAMTEDPALVVKAPLRQFVEAVERGDTFEASAVFGQFTFDAFTALEGSAQTAQNVARIVNQRMTRAAVQAERIRLIRELDQAVGARTVAEFHQNHALIFEKADFIASAHGAATGEVFVNPGNVKVRFFSDVGEPISIRKGMMIERGLESPTHVYWPNQAVPEHLLTPFGARAGEFVVTTGGGVFTVESATRLSEIVKHFSEMFPGKTICIDVSACRVFPGKLPNLPVDTSLLAARSPGFGSNLLVVSATDLLPPGVSPDTFTVPPGIPSALSVATNDGGPPGGEYVLVNGPSPALHTDLFEWHGNGTFSVAPLQGSPQITLTYRRVRNGEVSASTTVTIGVDSALLSTLVAHTDPLTGEDVVEVPTLELGPEHFPVYQFALRNNPNDACAPPHWHERAGPVYSIERPLVGFPDPNRPTCGYGLVSEVPLVSVQIPLATWQSFLGAHPPGP